MKKALLAILILVAFRGYGQYNPSLHIVVNDALSPAQATPTDSRSMFYDGANFVYRPYQNTAEVLSYLNLQKYRFGNFIIVIDSGGSLQSNGTYLNGTNTFWMFKDSTGNGGLIKLNLLGNAVLPSNLIDSIYRITDSTLGFKELGGYAGSVLLRGTAAGGITSLSLSTPTSLFVSPVNFTNTSGAWVGSLATANQSAGTFFAGPATGGLGQPLFRQIAISDLPTNIPNGNLANSSITLNQDNTGTSPGWATTSVSLGGTALYHNPAASATTSGYLLSSDWIRFNSAVTASVISVNGQTGVVVTLNADSLQGYPIDFTNFHNGWVLSIDTVHSKFVFSAPGSGSGISILNGLNPTTQYFATGYSGTSFNISSATATHTFNIPLISGADTGLVTPALYNSWNSKQAAISGNGFPYFTGTTITFYNGGSSTLYGVGSSGGTGVISLGTGLSMSGTTLNASGAQTLTYTQLALNNTLSISGGNTQTFLVATHALAGLMDSASKAVTDSLRLRTYTWPTVNLYSVQGLYAAGYDSVGFGNGFGFYEADTLKTNGYAFSIYGLPDTVATNSSDSVPILNWNHQMKLVAVSAIGGGGGGDAITSPNSTITVGGTSTNTTLDVNYAAFPQSFIPAVTNTQNLGSSGANKYWDYVYVNNVVAPGGLSLGASSTGYVNFAFNGVIKANLNYTGQWTWGSYNGNTFPGSTATDTVVVEDAGLVKTIPMSFFGLTANPLSQFASTTSAQLAGVLSDETGTGVAVFANSPQLVSPVLNTSSTTGYVWTATNSTGSGSWQAAAGGGSVTINGTTGSMSGSTLNLAVSGTSTTATGLTIPASGTTATWTYPIAWDFADNSRASTLTYFSGPLVGNTTLTNPNNMGVGVQVMQTITSGEYDEGIGVQSLHVITTGNQDLGVGWVTLFSLTTGNFNTAIGPGAMSGDTVGSENVAIGGIALDLPGNANDNTAVGYQAGGAYHGAPFGNTLMGDRNTSNWTGADTLVESYGAFNDQNNLANRKYTIEIGNHINYAGNVGLQNAILIGDSITYGSGVNGYFQNVTAIGHDLLFWVPGEAKFGTRAQQIILGDSGVLHYSNLPSSNQVDGALMFVQDSDYLFQYSRLLTKWVGVIPAALGISGGSGFANPMTSVGDLILVGTAGSATRLGIGTNTYVLTSNGTTASWQPVSVSSIALSSVTALTATTAINNGNFQWENDFNTLTAGPGFYVQSNNTTATAGQTIFEVLDQGINSTAGLVSYAAQFIQSKNTGTGGVGVAVRAQASASSANYAADLRGNVYLDNSTSTAIPTTPPAQFVINGTSAAATMQITTSSTAQYDIISFTAGGTTLGQFYALGTTYSTSNAFIAGGFLFRNGTSGGIILDAQFSTGNIKFYTGGDANYRGEVDSSGRFQLGTGGGAALVNIGAGTTTQGQLLLQASTLLTTPVNGMVEGTSSHVYYTAGGTRYQLDQQTGTTPTLQQVLTAGSTFTGANTITQSNNALTISGGQVVLGNTSNTRTWNPNSALAGSIISEQIGTLNDATTAASGTVGSVYTTGITTPTLTATNTGVVYTNAYTLYINAAPVASTNVSITNAYALGVAGPSLFQAQVSEPSLAIYSWQTITSGTSSTVNNSQTNWLLNLSTLATTFTVTLPAAPIDGQLVKLHFGGTISGGSTVVTALTVSANSGQTITQSAIPTTALSGNCYIYEYNAALAIWYREQ